MTFLDFTRSEKTAEHSGIDFPRNVAALLSIAASIVVMVGCGSTCPGHRQCHSRSVHSVSCHNSRDTEQSHCQSAVESPLYRSNEVASVDEDLMGGCGMATGDSYSIESPVEVAPVPLQYSQPMEYAPEKPAIELEMDPMQLDESQVADPMEI